MDGIEADASKQLTRRCFVKVPLQDMQDFSHRKDFFLKATAQHFVATGKIVRRRRQ